MKCRFCETHLEDVFIDLVGAPASNSFLSAEELDKPETYFPLKLFVCRECFLVQVPEYKNSSEIFNARYLYFSSFSSSWLEHCKAFVEQSSARFVLDNKSLVIEIASNDGYLLQYFLEKGVPVLGIEPTANTAEIAKGKGIETIVRFFNRELAQSLHAAGKRPNLIIGNNVLAHVPDLNDFVEGLKILLDPDGVISMEFPHLLQLVEQNQFDTIYHEHFSYLSLSTVFRIFFQFGLELFDVEEVPTHGGSLRIFAKHIENNKIQTTSNVSSLIAREEALGLKKIEYYRGFQTRVRNIMLTFWELLISIKKEGKSVAAYGAAAKGNTLLNYFGIKNGLIEYVVDASPHKQGLFLPGSHIPVVAERRLLETKPDFVLILPWNLKEEITKQLAYIREWGGKFILPIPEPRIIE